MGGGQASREGITVEGGHPEPPFVAYFIVSVCIFCSFHYALSFCNSEVRTAIVHFTWLAAPVRGIHLDSGKSSYYSTSSMNLAEPAARILNAASQ